MISVDTSSVYELSKSLNEIHRAAFPNAVRDTLNDAAFDVKKNTLLVSAKENFDNIRQPNLFKKYSGVEKATGWEVNAMKSTVGLVPSGEASRTIERFEQQEGGGSLEHKAIPLNKARISGSLSKSVRGNVRLDKTNKIGTVAYKDTKKLIRLVTASGIERSGRGKGTVVLYGKFLYEIIGFRRLRNTNSIKLHLNRLYKYNKADKLRIKPTHFMKEANLKTGAHIPEYFAKAAEKQFTKFMNR